MADQVQKVSRGKWLRFLALPVLALMVGTSMAPRSAGATASYDYALNVHPFHKYAFSLARAQAGFPLPSDCVSAIGIACYTPSAIRTAYNVPNTLTGAGQTIVIVDAYGNANIQSELQIFDSAFGLPNPPSFQVIAPNGITATDPATAASWASETSLDVEWSHAIAPGANIVLIEARSNMNSDLNLATQYAYQHHLGNIMSLSFGESEFNIPGEPRNSGISGPNNPGFRQTHLILQSLANAKTSIFVSAGDFGANNNFYYGPGGQVTSPSASTPASDPLVTSVGGTNLFAADDGTYQGENVWNDSAPSQCPFGCTQGIFGATGGAPSHIYSSPAYQGGVTGYTGRAVADVSYNASVYTGILVFTTAFDSGNFFIFGGTSEGAPQWAGIAALVNQARGQVGKGPLGQFNPALYAIGANPTKYANDFHDVTIGNNGFFSAGFSAGTGYDVPTGLGSPNVANLIPDLVAAS